MPQTTPVEEKIPASPESQTPVAPETPPEVPIVTESPVEEAPAPIEAPKAPEDEQAVLKKRLSGALQENEKRTEELRRAQRLQVDMVRESPEYIHRIAKEDPSMANKVIQEVWGDNGIRSYKQLQEFIKLQEIKETDPNAYETKKELLDVKSRLEAREEREQAKIKREFLEKKGVIVNPYDPTYKKLEDALQLLNPQIVKDDPEHALKLAWNLVNDQPPSAPTVPKPTLNVGGGVPSAPVVKTSDGDSEFSWAYNQWKKQKKK